MYNDAEAEIYRLEEENERLRKALREVTDALAAYGFSSSPSDPVMKAREVLKEES